MASAARRAAPLPPESAPADAPAPTCANALAVTPAARARFAAVAAATVLRGAPRGTGQVVTHRRLARRHTSDALGPRAPVDADVPMALRGFYHLLDERRRVVQPGRARVRLHVPVEVRGRTCHDLPGLLAAVRETVRADLADCEVARPLR